MISRCSISRALRLQFSNQSLLKAQRPGTSRIVTRQFGSTSSAASGGALQAPTSVSPAPLSSLKSELDKIAPCFSINANQIEIIKEPKEFYETLKFKILNAKRRVFISTLYVGKTENDLIAALRESLRSHPQLTVSILVDYLRGTRESPDPSCASLLSSLAAEFGDRVEIRMFHTPNLTGLKKFVLPKRINEGWGLQHMKLYGFDDEIILSGANLSNDYFTNRQDRYHLLRSAEVTGFYERVHDAVCSMSFRLTPSQSTATDFELEWPSKNPGPSPLEDPKGYMSHAANVFAPLLRPQSSTGDTSRAVHNPKPTAAAFSTGKTLLYPLFQVTPLLPKDPSCATQSTELPALTLLLQNLSQPSFQPAQWTFTAGYFNMTPTTRNLLLFSLQQISLTSLRDGESPRSHGTIITAHPHANGFFGSAGVSGMLPAAYTLMSKRFLEAVHAKGLQHQLSLHEWKRGTFNKPDRWTYHAKGLWVTLPGSDATVRKDHPLGPSITLVGSSNYTQRSHTLDLEANALILTTDSDLQRRLREEEEHLMQYAGREVSLEEFAKPEKRVGLGVRISLWITNLIGGAL